MNKTNALVATKEPQKYTSMNGSLNRKVDVTRLGEYKEDIDKILKKQQEKQEAMDVLKGYSSEISDIISSYNRKSCEETMMVKGYRKFSQETTNRKIHQENLENIAVRIAKSLGLNHEITSIMARNHDIGHTFLGHSGEWWLSNVKEDFGIGYYCHNALGARDLIYSQNVYDEIIEEIRFNHPDILDKKLDKIRGSLWLVMEGINSHNGERSESEYRADLLKTEEDFEQELLYCHTQKGYDKKLVPATPEAALMRLCDKISYIPYDMLDGLREGFIDKLDEDYVILLKELGISDEELVDCTDSDNFNKIKSCEKIARKLQNIFINDVIKNSNKGVIKMSEKTSKLMHKLRTLNNEKIVDYVLIDEDKEIYPVAVKDLMKQYGTLVINESLVDRIHGEKNSQTDKELIKKYKNTPYMSFIQYTCTTSQKDFEYTEKMIKEAIRQSIQDEQEKARQIVLNDEEFVISDEFKRRDMRIQNYIKYYRNKHLEKGYDENQKQEDVEIIMQNIMDKGKKDHAGLYVDYDSAIALELGAKYLASLNDIEFMQTLEEFGIVDLMQKKKLTKKYKDIPNLKERATQQSNWKAISTEQAQAVEEVK